MRIPIALAFAASASAAAAGEWADADYQEHCANATSTVEIVQCIGDLHAEWDARLNAAYQSSIAALPEPRQTALRDVQRAWIAYRDANCGFYRGGEGTIAAVEAALCIYGMTRDRARELEGPEVQ